MKAILKHYGNTKEYIITCPKCNTDFLSNKKSYFLLNEIEYTECPYCNKHPEISYKQFLALSKKCEPIYIADEYKENKHWRVYTFPGCKFEYHELNKINI